MLVCCVCVCSAVLCCGGLFAPAGASCKTRTQYLESIGNNENKAQNLAISLQTRQAQFKINSVLYFCCWYFEKKGEALKHKLSMLP